MGRGTSVPLVETALPVFAFWEMSLNSWSCDLEQLIDAQPLKKFFAFCKPKVQYCNQKNLPLLPVLGEMNLILFSYLCVYLLTFLLVSPPKLSAFRFPPIRAKCPSFSHLILLDLFMLTIFWRRLQIANFLVMQFLLPFYQVF
jgi:hypothetical protein